MGFSNFGLLNLIKSGSLISEENSFKAIARRRYGAHTPLKNPDTIPTMVLATARNDNEMLAGQLSEKLTSCTYDPFILRSYDYPPDVNEQQTYIFDGTSDVKLYEAMAATSAVPGAVDRVRIMVDGKQKSLADGMGCCNNPVAIAMHEARVLYPNRPLGVVLSIGFGSGEDPLIQRAVEMARFSSPGLHFQRIVPDLGSFSATETDVEKIKQMQDEVRNYVRTDPRVKRGLQITLDKLYKPAGRDVRRGRKRKGIVSLNPFDRPILQKSGQRSGKMMNILNLSDSIRLSLRDLVHKGDLLVEDESYDFSKERDSYCRCFGL